MMHARKMHESGGHGQAKQNRKVHEAGGSGQMKQTRKVPSRGGHWQLNLPTIPKPLEYATVFYIFACLGATLLLDMVSSLLLALFCMALYYAARNKEWVMEHFGKILAIQKYGRTNQNRAIKMLTDNLLWLYVVILSVRLYLSGMVLLPDHVVFYGLVGALLVGRGIAFVRDWAPIFVLYFAYEAMRGISDTLGVAVHFTEPIGWDQAIFGFLPNTVLQNAFFVPGVAHWYDIAAMGLYALHMGMPLIFAFLVWISDRPNFIKYTSALLLTSYLGLVTFMIYPMAPPWMAAQYGLTNVHQILFETSDIMGFKIFPTLYLFINSNPVAAMPSLHAAYPILILIFAARIWKLKGALPALVYAIAMWLSLIYLGEHYAIDIFAGFIYAIVGVLVVDWASKSSAWRTQYPTERQGKPFK